MKPTKPLSKTAKILIRKFSKEFTDALILQAQLWADRNGDEEVLASHVNKAANMLPQESYESSKRKTWLLLIGSALLGASIQGTISEVSNYRADWVGIYALIGFIGVLLMFWGLQVHR